MKRLPAPLAIIAGIALVVGALFALQAATGDGYVPMAKNCGCVFAGLPI
jgi:hypothetical protein